MSTWLHPYAAGAAWFLHYSIIKCERRGGREDLGDKLSDSNKQDLVILLGVYVCVHISFLFFFFIGGELFYKLVLGLMALNILSFFRCQNMLKIGWLEILAWGQS